MPPKVSIIIPVYNVESYLRQCLDSVVNQTMLDIQIICVNDGSPDNSRAILQEYADRDSRIEIIDKPNGGLSSARNAAYPSINGKYTMFVDSDDWIDLDTCERLFDKAEQTGTEIVVFFRIDEYPSVSREPLSRLVSPGRKTTPQEKCSVLLHHPSACGKFLRSDFLLGRNITFPEGLIFEDNVFHWQTITQAGPIVVFPEPFYHYRYNPNSITRSTGKRHLDIVPVYNLILSNLQEAGLFSVYQEIFIPQKLETFRHYYHSTFRHRADFLRLIHGSLTEDDRIFYRSKAGKAMKKRTLSFYRGLVDGNRQEALKYYLHEAIKLPERLMKHTIVRPLRTLIGNWSNSTQKGTTGIIPFPPSESDENRKRHVA